jgi:hypothetical protein
MIFAHKTPPPTPIAVHFEKSPLKKYKASLFEKAFRKSRAQRS